MGIPAVVSPVGANKEIVITGETGFWCQNENAWYEALEQLITNPELRAKMGKKGRKHGEKHYSIKANQENMLQIFRNIC